MDVIVEKTWLIERVADYSLVEVLADILIPDELKVPVDKNLIIVEIYWPIKLGRWDFVLKKKEWFLFVKYRVWFIYILMHNARLTMRALASVQRLSNHTKYKFLNNDVELISVFLRQAK